VDENPFLQPLKENAELEIVYEDEYLLVVNKPAGLRSVPGVDIQDSVYSRLKATLVHTEPLSCAPAGYGYFGTFGGSQNVGGTQAYSKAIPERTVSKRYTALLSKVIDEAEGHISLPLCADPFNRPRQLVCFTTGKKASPGGR